MGSSKLDLSQSVLQQFRDYCRQRGYKIGFTADQIIKDYLTKQGIKLESQNKE